MVSHSHHRSKHFHLSPRPTAFKRSATKFPISITTMANSENTVPNPHDANAPLTSLNLSQCVKLTSTNYTSWRFQLTHILFGFSLLGYLDGSTPQPTETLPSDEKSDQPKPNPAYHTWLKQDGLILGALMGTLTPTIQALIVRAKTSKEAWDILAHTFANPSRTHILQLKDRLDSTVKASNQTITDYMHAIKACVDQLALMGKVLDPEDVISKVLRGLDYNVFKPVIDAVRARDTPISFEALHEKLLQLELLSKQNPLSDPFPPTVNAGYRQPYNNYRNTNRTTTTSNPPSQPPRPFKGRCQWCRQVGHVIADCPNFRKLFPNIIFPAPPTKQHQAHTATSGSSAPNPAYLLDSGASNHVTYDVDTLALHSPYVGTDGLLIGDGSSLEITNIGDQEPQNPTPRQG